MTMDDEARGALPLRLSMGQCSFCLIIVPPAVLYILKVLVNGYTRFPLHAVSTVTIYTRFQPPNSVL